MFLMWVGSEFQAAGPATANEPSAKCVVVRRTVKSPRTDDRRRWSLHRLRLHKSVKYPSFRGKRRTSKRKIVCTLCVSKSEASVGGAAVVQRDYELVLSKKNQTSSTVLDSLHSLADSHAAVRQRVRCSSPNVM